MHESDDLSMQHITQIGMNCWLRGRVTVVGDAGYSPSPVIGMGTSIAFIGAYVLASEISRQPNNTPAARESYERVLCPYGESIQKLSPGIPWIVNPQSKLDIKVLKTVAWIVGLVSTTWLATLFSKFASYLSSGEKGFDSPDYEAFRVLILTPLARFYQGYSNNLLALSYPRDFNT